MGESCRICFSTDDLIAFDTVLCDDTTYEDIFYYCTQLERNDNSTHIKICAFCKDELQNIYSFIEKAKVAWLRMHADDDIYAKDDRLENFEVEFLAVGADEIKSDAGEEELTKDDLDESNDDLCSTRSIDDASQEEFYLETIYENETDCNKETKAQHIKQFDETSRSMSCNECSRTFKRKDGLTKHQKFHHKHREKKQVSNTNSISDGNDVNLNNACEYCGKHLSTPSSKARHIKQMHETSTFLCDKCPRSFKDSIGLRKHRKIHQQNRARKYACKYCGLKLLTRGNCRAHEDTHNVKREKKYKCDQCEKAFYAMGALNVHKRKHTGEGVQCEICKKHYTRLIDVQIHMRTHTNERPFECETCEKKFFSKSSLTVHIKKEHLGFKHKCYVCFKLFKDQELFQQHKAAEHSTFLFDCTMCNRSFAKGHLLKRHLKRVHGKTDDAD